jgi:RNA polymerase sigma-70 factor (ECF subfamily)
MKDSPTTIEQSFLEAYNQHADAIFRYCYFQTSNREVALDLSQDTFTKTWEYLKSNHEVENIKAFLYKVARNLIIDYRRKKKSSSLDSLMEEGFDYSETEDIQTEKETEFDSKIAKEALEELGDSYKEILTLRYIDDLSITEIAERTGMTENNISVKIHRGLQKLNEILTDNN